MVHDGTPGPKCDPLYSPVFSRDSKHLAYFSKIGSKAVVFLDDHRLPPCDDVACGFVFRGDGKLEYIAQNEEAGATVLYRVIASF
jgi:hypothetical protein